MGTLFPQTGRLDDRLGPGWAAVAIDGRSRALLRAAGVEAVDPAADGEWLRARGLTWALLRPDRYVFACGALGDVRAGIAGWRRITAIAALKSAA